MKTFTSGKNISQGYYKSFQPNEINKVWELSDMDVIQLLSQADRHLGRLDMYSEYVNIDLFIRMHIAKEATQSSKIEGKLIADLEKLQILKEISGAQRNKLYVFSDYLNLFKNNPAE